MDNYYGAPNDFRQYLQGDSLAHFGILGMKWGVRRYQNPDGSLTSAGKKRYAKDLVNVYNQTAKKGGAYWDKNSQKWVPVTIHDSDKGRELLKDDENIKRIANKIADSKLSKEVIDHDARVSIDKDLSEQVDAYLKDYNLNKNDDVRRFVKQVISREADDLYTKGQAKQKANDKVFKETIDIGSNKVLKDKRGERADQAADLGIKAWQKLGRNMGDGKPGDESTRSWFKYEDQTIGDLEVADLCRQFGSKEKVMDIMKTCINIPTNLITRLYGI